MCNIHLDPWVLPKSKAKQFNDWRQALDIQKHPDILAVFNYYTYGVAEKLKQANLYWWRCDFASLVTWFALANVSETLYNSEEWKMSGTTTLQLVFPWFVYWP